MGWNIPTEPTLRVGMRKPQPFLKIVATELDTVYIWH